MKNVTLLLFALLLFSCDDEIYPPAKLDDPLSEQEQKPETPPEGLKLKGKGGLLSQSFFYNKNGFIDSISSYHGWGDDFTEKFIYNNLNQIVEYRYVVDEPGRPEYFKKNTTFYTYNTKNQIISSLTYDKNNVAIAYKTYNYTTDGGLFSSNRKVVNENIVEDSNGTVKYQFDDKRNPYYNIYPKAYRILKFINKNNILVTERHYSSEVITNTHSLKYNADNYIISEEISNMPLDTDDRRSFTYY
ncbi:hypothetical protein H1R17_10475 [Flavobacterium sp. xlx-214]|uniref:hypothetical protein n=1 Tax=unclassified Flavobacterium TaxID=196869 RepID=UPI0013D558D7|nr:MULTISPECIES: hypothetical protein [unclassified Flavobacterium]MBA5791640.1 hypothetical protein [Flavobacterium sp. xlx-221]QMI82884.1 hypothetical protein H1R17_10475 [Flavobacterium sp. xlx-214]